MLTQEFISKKLKQIMIKKNYSEEQARWDLSITYPEADELIWNTPINKD